MKTGLTIAGALVVLFATTTPAYADDENPVDDPPVIHSASVTPSTLPWQGGAVHVEADVTDDIMLTDVSILEYDGTRLLQELPYTGPLDVDIPADRSSQGHTYQFVVRARDSYSDLSGNPREVYGSAGNVVQAGRVNAAPVLSDVAATPRTLPATGGSATVSAQVTDDPDGYLYGTMTATATPPAGQPISVRMLPGVDGYSAAIPLPANTGTSAQPYALSVTAQDFDGPLSTTADAGTATVAPPAPTTGTLQVRPGSVAFGPARVGATRLSGFILRNTGARGTAPVTGTLAIAGTDFALPGTAARSLPFRLAAGASAIVAVTFRPVARGTRTGTVVITRADAARPPISVPLTGRGT